MEKEKILVVEDERIVADDLRMSLERLGYLVCGLALSGSEAIEKVKELRPDIVIMDIVLGEEMDGIEAASKIRSSFEIPVVYLTAYGDEKTLERAKVTEPFGYIIKPFEERELQSAIEIALYKYRMEKKLKESERWLSTTLRSIGDAVIATDKKGQVSFINPVAQSLTGWKNEEAIGRTLRDIFITLNEETGQPIAGSGIELLQKDRQPEVGDHILLVSRDGNRIPINQSTAPIQDEKGDVIGAVLAFQDITERKKAMDELKKAWSDLKETQQQLIQSEKLAALGRFSSGVAHEIKNPLGIILGGLEFLEGKLVRADKDVKTSIDKVKEATFRANTIVQGLLNFARPSELKIERVKPSDLINETLSLLKYKTPLSSIEVETIFSDEELYIEADRNQMQQVFFNLLLNAIEAMPEGGVIKIKTKKKTVKEFFISEHFCVIEIIDSGTGITEENLKRLFEPFFTTKRERKGTGLGLTMTKLIVENHKGSLEIESKPGKGTTARIILPIPRGGEKQ
jgi:two-component system cell cycle sensor histidine kinase/response regulator CckA